MMKTNLLCCCVVCVLFVVKKIENLNLLGKVNRVKLCDMNSLLFVGLNFLFVIL